MLGTVGLPNPEGRGVSWKIVDFVFRPAVLRGRSVLVDHSEHIDQRVAHPDRPHQVGDGNPDRVAAAAEPLTVLYSVISLRHHAPAIDVRQDRLTDAACIDNPIGAKPDLAHTSETLALN
jgi:hypothetical protein